MEVVAYNAYDLKYLSNADLSYNPALGTGQIQVKDIHYVSMQKRTNMGILSTIGRQILRLLKAIAERLDCLGHKERMDKGR